MRARVSIRVVYFSLSRSPFLSLSIYLSLSLSLFLSTSLIIKNQRLLKVRSPLAIAMSSSHPFARFLYLHPRRNLQFEILSSRTKKRPVLSRDACTKVRVGSLSTSSDRIMKRRQKYFAPMCGTIEEIITSPAISTTQVSLPMR